VGYIIIATILTLIAGVVGFAAILGAFGAVTEERDPVDRTVRRVRHTYRSGPLLATAAIWAVLIALTTVFASYRQVEAGTIGVVRTFGEISGQLSEGPNFIAPWKSVQTFDIRVQRADFRNSVEDDDSRVFGRIEAASFETQDVFMDLTLNWQVSPSAVQELVRNVGPNFFDVLVPTRVRQHAKAIVVEFTAVEATQQREEIRSRIAAALQDDLGAFSITVVSLQIDNISYQPEFSAAIEEKQVATQNALRAEELIRQRQAEARQAEAVAEGEAAANIARATGEAEAIRVRATAQAEANREIAASLTQPLIQWEALGQLEGVSLALLPADGTTIVDPTGILRGQPLPVLTGPAE
jgi:regulator of protease activity HflC (stomatin/prohibitin superfamily)